jgi:hypothetical protein
MDKTNNDAPTCFEIMGFCEYLCRKRLQINSKFIPLKTISGLYILLKQIQYINRNNETIHINCILRIF